MFHNGDIQSGIARALIESKLVGCFVRDDSNESALWENDFLKDPDVFAALSAKVVLLRITANSTEAGYLSAYYPVPAIPALIILQNGRVLLCLGAGLEKSQFKQSILKTLENLLSQPETAERLSRQATANSTSSAESTLAVPQNHSLAPAEGITTSQRPSEPQLSSATSASASASSPPSAVLNMLAERRQRLEREKKSKEAAEKAERQAKADSRRAAVSADPTSAKAKQASYADQQRKRNHEAKLERERILKNIENNKVERKEKEERGKALAELEIDNGDGAGGLVNQQLERESWESDLRKANKCAIQVRLFDGSTVRHSFPLDTSLRSHVRPWILEHKSDGDAPYTLKQILTPNPNRTISITEENESLRFLGFAPSATLVKVPVQGYTAAYANNSSSLYRFLFTIYTLLASVVGVVTSPIRGLLGMGRLSGSEQEPRAAVEHPPPPKRSLADTGRKIDIRSLRDQSQDHDDHQLYNGNQLNFEPQRKTDDEED